MRRKELPLLGGIAGFFHWLEALLIITSGPLLTVGLGIALVDLLTGGQLLATQPGLLYAWAISQAAGVDAQLVASAAKLAGAVHERRLWVAAGYGALIVPLAYVGFLASNVFATQEADGITTAAALGRLGMDSTSWIVQRSALAVALVVLSGLLRYRPPDAERTAEDERATLERELSLEPMRAQLRASRAVGWRSVAAAIAGKPAVRTDRTPDALSGPSAPLAASTGTDGQVASGVRTSATTARPDMGPHVIRLLQHAAPVKRQSPRTKARQTRKAREVRTGQPGNASYEAEARRAWADGARTIPRMRHATGMGQAAAMSWVRTLKAEEQAATQAEAQEA